VFLSYLIRTVLFNPSYFSLYMVTIMAEKHKHVDLTKQITFNGVKFYLILFLHGFGLSMV
jgi:hypothetical protein